MASFTTRTTEAEPKPVEAHTCRNSKNTTLQIGAWTNRHVLKCEHVFCQIVKIVRLFLMAGIQTYPRPCDYLIG